MSPEIARMRFKSAKRPEEHGVLVLRDDGTFQIQPSEDLRAEMSRLEDGAVKRSQRLGYGIGFALLALGTAAVFAGWLCSRAFGKLGGSMSTPRNVHDVEIDRNEAGSIRIRMRGIESRLQTILMAWNVDEILPDEADRFIAAFEEMKTK
ncbi:MAG: hypothetical protein ACLQVD_00145 [Capsulimonadaceae bacterium]